MRSKCCCYMHIFYLLVAATVVFSENQDNPADDIVDRINLNRAASKLPKLYDSPGLGCMALQLIAQCTANCSSNSTLNCNPPEVDITEIYAPNCGVELPTVTSITGHLVGCHWNYLDPQEAFLKVIASDNKSLTLVHSKEHSGIGAGYSGARHGPFLWCVLFSNGRTNSTFVLDSKMGIKDSSGCFSGRGLPCSAAVKQIIMLQSSTSVIVFSTLLSIIIVIMIF